MYSNGGCIARAGSCKMGFKPNPSSGTGLIRLNGFELNNMKNKKPNIKIFCTIKSVSNSIIFRMAFF